MVNKWAGGFVLAVVSFYALNRLGSRRGATIDEVRMPLPGDDLAPKAMIETTHGITIQAPAEAIWPWLVQVGYHRGGWYADSKIHSFLFKYLFEPMAPEDKKPEYRASAGEILAEYQDLKPGDIIPDGPPDTAHFIVKGLDPNHYLALFTDQYHQAILPESLATTGLQPRSEFSWVFVLNEYRPGRTRLVLRARISIWPRILFPLLWIPLMLGEAVYPHLMLKGIKERVERQSAE